MEKPESILYMPIAQIAKELKIANPVSLDFVKP